MIYSLVFRLRHRNGCAAIHKRAQQQHAQQHRTALAVRCCPASLFPSYPYHTVQLTLLYAKCDGLFIVKRNKTSAIILPNLIFFINWQVCQTSFWQIVQHDLAFLWNFIKLMDLLIFHIFRFSVEFFLSGKPWACPALLPAHIGKARIGCDLLNLFIKIQNKFNGILYLQKQNWLIAARKPRQKTVRAILV